MIDKLKNFRDDIAMDFRKSLAKLTILFIFMNSIYILMDIYLLEHNLKTIIIIRIFTNLIIFGLYILSKVNSKVFNDLYPHLYPLTGTFLTGLITYFSLSTHEYFTEYFLGTIIVFFVLALFIPLTRPQSIQAFLINYFAFVIAVMAYFYPHINNEYLLTMAYLAFFGLTAFFASQLLYQYRINDYQRRIKMTEQNEEIKAKNKQINESLKQLKEKETFLNTVIENIPTLIYVKDADNLRYIRFNKAGEELLGMSRYDIIGSNDYEIFDHNFADFHHSIDKAVLKNQSLINVPEEVINTKRGETKYIHTMKLPISDGHGIPKFILGISVDITEQKQYEHALQESEEKYKSLINNALEGIIVIQRERIVFHNPVTESILGFSSRYLMGFKFYLNVHADDISRVRKIVREKMQGEKSEENFIFRIHTKSGKTRWIEAKSVLIEWSGKPAILSLFNDITERKSSEEEIAMLVEKLKNQKETLEDVAKEMLDLNKKLRRSEKQLKAINADKDKFFSIIAHDLKNPIGSFLTGTELMVDKFSMMEPQRQKKFMLSMKDSARNLYSLLENLLAWSRSQRGMIAFTPVEYNFTVTVNRIFSLVNQLAANKNISLESNIKENTMLVADKDMIFTVLRNLVTNSIKFTPVGGKIELNIEQANGMSTITVADNGVGISEENKTKLFKIDESIKSKGTANETGTGLGLILCKEFIEKHNGNIWVDSKINQGSVFTVQIPKIQPVKLNEKEEPSVKIWK